MLRFYRNALIDHYHLRTSQTHSRGGTSSCQHNSRWAGLHTQYSLRGNGSSARHSFPGSLPKDGYFDRVVPVMAINSSQDGIVVSSLGISPTHTAGHGNIPKVIVEYDL